jgi:hypothetical protein
MTGYRSMNGAGCAESFGCCLLLAGVGLGFGVWACLRTGRDNDALRTTSVRRSDGDTRIATKASLGIRGDQRQPELSDFARLQR